MKQRFTSLSLQAALLVAASMAGTAFAQDQNTVVVPDSSIERPADIGVRAHTNIRYIPNISPSGPPATAETPASLACVYHLTTVVKGCPIATTTALPTGGAKAIGIVDAYDNPDATTDLATYSAQFGLPAANFSQVYATGKKPANNAGGWSLEEALDIEMAHAMAPNAEIILVEAASNSFADLYLAESVASNLVAAAGGGEVTNSWSGGEYSTELTDEATYFTTPTVVYFASTGDTAFSIGVPSVFASVVAAGGTTLERTSGNFTGEQYWDNATGGGGGGLSVYEKTPSYQKGITAVGTHRGVPDISFDADPDSGPAMYDADGGYGWFQVGGTSVSSPALSGVINAAAGFSSTSKAELTKMYKEYHNATEYKQWFRDITKGNAKCTVGWDICTGIGSVVTYKGK
jgi:subtilase family serine protease